VTGTAVGTIVDSHCHLNYLDDPDARLAAAASAGVEGVLCIGVNREGFADVAGLAARHDHVWATAGIHPDSVSSTDDLTWVRETAQQGKVVGIGETGLDYYRLDEGDAATRSLQRERFAEHLAIAAAAELPVVVHTRAAEGDTQQLIAANHGTIGVLHCFTESWSLAEAALDCGYYVSISGIVTFTNADNVREVAKKVPADRLLVETDAPWLAPVPHRGKTNEPAFVRATAEYLATLRGVSYAELAATTSENFYRLFNAVRR
jgi:TatD DNase family protein